MVTIYVDEREKSSQVPKILLARGITVIFKMLDVGDYIVSDRIGIERKSANDFISSIVDGRLFDQAKRLCSSFEKPIIIVEGSLQKALRLRNIHRNAVLGAYISLALDFGITVIQTRNEEESAEVIKRIALREYEKGRKVKAITSTGTKVKGRSIRELQLQVLQCFPYIGPKIAQRILEVFGSIQRFCNASLSELARIEGLSESKASEIIQILRAQYTSTHHEERKDILSYLKKESK